MATTSSPVELFGPDLEDEHDPRAWPARARAFARDVVAPFGEVLDRMDARELAEPGSPLRELLAQAHREGFTRLADPSGLGGSGLSRRERYLVLEELATADAAVTALLLVAPVPFQWAGALGATTLVRDVAVPYLSARRSDWVGTCAVAGRAAPLRATRTDEGWMLCGETPPVPAAAIATHALVACRVTGTGSEGVAVVPLEVRGVWRGPVDDADGLRALCRARLTLDRVRVREDHVLAGRAGAASSAYAHAATALLAFGIGRAAYEGTVRWAREGVWAGRPASMRDHVRPQLYRMFTLLEVARALVRAAYLAGDVPPAGGDAAFADHARAARAFAAEAASEVAGAAVRLCAPDATRHGVPFLDGSVFHPDKLLRDARAAHE